jgi:hypothetical protein
VVSVMSQRYQDIQVFDRTLDLESGV